MVKYAHDYGRLTLLSVRSNATGEYHRNLPGMARTFGFESPKIYKFTCLQECLIAAKELRNLEEGFVLYQDGIPVGKCKNPAYVAAHHLRGEGCLTEKRVLDLIVMNETAEYLSIFPEDTDKFAPYIKAQTLMVFTIRKMAESVVHFTGSQKEFAMLWKDTPIAPIAFAIKSGKTEKEAWDRLTRTAKHRMITAYKL